MSGTEEARTGGDPGPADREEDPDPTALRRARWLLLAGVGLGLAGAVATGLLGASGDVGLLLVLVGTAFGSALSAVWLLGSALVDEFRGRPVSRRRPLWGGIAFATAGLTMITLLGMAP